jgi:hypothetical protein
MGLLAVVCGRTEGGQAQDNRIVHATNDKRTSTITWKEAFSCFPCTRSTELASFFCTCSRIGLQ